jgi:hypothetical protein
VGFEPTLRQNRKPDFESHSPALRFQSLSAYRAPQTLRNDSPAASQFATPFFDCGAEVMSEVYVLDQDGKAKLLGVASSLRFELGEEPMLPAPAMLSGSVSISFDEFSRQHLLRIAKAFGLKRKMLYSPREQAFERLRRQMKAKLCGRNWRQV